MLQSSDRGGLRIQYSKNPYGKKRDISGGFVNPYAAYGAPGVDPGAPGADPQAPGVDGSLQPGVPGGQDLCLTLSLQHVQRITGSLLPWHSAHAALAQS